MSNISKRRKEGGRTKIKSIGEHNDFLRRITKSLYYGNLPELPTLSLPVTELSANLFSQAHKGRTLKRLHLDEAAEISRNACISPCSLVLAILYLERLRACNPEYLNKIAPSELFLISLMVSNKFLQDDGEDDEVICKEWATSGGIDLTTLKQLERDFLQAIDWRVFVSQDSFENGLSWLEEQVALKQTESRGFYTYSDLEVLTRNLDVQLILKHLSSAYLAVLLTYVVSLVTVLTSSLLIYHICIPQTQIMLTRDSPINNTSLKGEAFNNNNLDSHTVNELFKCCVKWKNIESNNKNNNINNVLKSYKTWWPITSIDNWLNQITVIIPFEKLLEDWNIVNYTSYFYKRNDYCDPIGYPFSSYRLNKCFNQWASLRQMPLVVSDR